MHDRFRIVPDITDLDEEVPRSQNLADNAKRDLLHNTWAPESAISSYKGLAGQVDFWLGEFDDSHPDRAPELKAEFIAWVDERIAPHYTDADKAYTFKNKEN